MVLVGTFKYFTAVHFLSFEVYPVEKSEKKKKRQFSLKIKLLYKSESIFFFFQLETYEVVMKC